MRSAPDPHYRHRFPAEIISHAVWLYHVFSLSLRDVELLLAERGIVVSYETVRRWCQKFGESFADRLRRRRPRSGDKWHLDEVFIRVQGIQRYLWRAVDQDGVVPDILVQERRDGSAAKRFFKRLLKGLQYVPRAIITDKLRSYGWRNDACCPMSSIDKVATSTIVLRTHIVQHGDENGRCNASSPLTTRSTSCRLMHLSTATFIHADTSWRPRLTAPSVRRRSVSGSRRRASGLPPDTHSTDQFGRYVIYSQLR
jgi:transposase-like protein